MRKKTNRTWCLAILAFLLIDLSAPHALADSQAARRRPKIGLALSGGGARGAAHIGVLKVLEREKIPIDYIAGTSFGALVGGFYALGYSAAEVEKIFTSQDWNKLFSDAPDRSLAPLIQRRNLRYLGEFPFRGYSPELPTGLWMGQKLVEVFNDYTAERIIAANYDFDRLPIPFRAVATDLVTGKPYIFRRGRMTEAMRASIAIPLFYVPLEKEDMLLVDGSLADNLPTDIVREMGAEFVIAVDVTSPLSKKDGIRTLFDVMDQSLSLLMRQNVEKNARLADIVIRPDLESFTPASYAEVAEIVGRGETAALAHNSELPRLTANSLPTTSISGPAPAATPFIDSISFQGLTSIDPSLLFRELKTRSGKTTDWETLRKDLRRLYATRLFEQVDFNLEPVGDNHYRLNYLVKESPRHTLGASIRYDRDYKFVALAEFNAQRVFGTPSTATISSQFGGLENHSANLRLIHPALPSVFLEPQIQFLRRERLDIREREQVDRFIDKRLGGQLMLGSALFKEFEMLVGYRDERVSIIGGSSPNREPNSTRLSGLRLRFDRDTLDAQDYPQSGMLVAIQVDQLSTSLGGDFNHSKVQGDLERYFSLSEKSTFRIHGGAALSHGPLPFYERFYIGGYSFSEHGPRQLLGFSRDELAARQAILLGADYRRQIFSRPLSFARRGFLSLQYNLAGISDKESSPRNFKYLQGVGFGFSLDTIAGPLRFAGGWGEGGRVNFYLSLGPAF